MTIAQLNAEQLRCFAVRVSLEMMGLPLFWVNPNRRQMTCAEVETNALRVVGDENHKDMQYYITEVLSAMRLRGTQEAIQTYPEVIDWLQRYVVDWPKEGQHA
jgi:hypothetical protein